MFECKLICTDIDGTLLNGNHQITLRTKDALRRARRRGIIVALVSGRIASSLAVLQQEIGIQGPLGCFNGSLVLDEDGTELEAHPIRLEQALEVLDAVRHTELEAFVFTNESWYTKEKSHWYDIEIEASRTEGRIVPFSELESSFHPGERPFKVLCMHHDPAYVEETQTSLQATFGTSLNILNSSPKYIEIMARGVDKGHAVRSLCNAYSIDASSVMAVGDFYNDIGMFRASGYSVAMGNAPQAVKECAIALTKSNDEDGLALAIEAIL
ncbi:MAG TPA: Cof-type HAD-IIB family hydrolase [Sphaerochaeta sp.]|jgi:Cof subfamily protein (haloacid dehalogenase superfamily)|uniref:Cof-type HAD-IIB family hydrolase n=1 Tax=Sphaerochaeta sp. TaxID=1972642 RepID=UPI000ECB75BB|nr:Cof-type HAD-IIB family hydrolase [Sphaerochaeta sp.]MDX9824935.1 Cof-type HAD-IIB family hydrolase [Sphaerochaeta sp.]HCU29662.1 Cof-type HAD-IIB family hydrolase [Sphaerochaeta sp.]